MSGNKLAHSRRRDVLRVGSILAWGFTRSPLAILNAPLAWCAIPAFTLLAILFGHRNAYLTASRRGVIIVLRYPRTALLARIFVLVIVSVVAAHGIPQPNMLVVTLIFIVLLAYVLAQLSVVRRTGRQSFPPPPEDSTQRPRAPVGRGDYVVQALAAQTTQEKAGIEALSLARTFISKLPPGARIHAHAANHRLHTAYLRFGFEATGPDGRHLVYVVRA